MKKVYFKVLDKNQQKIFPKFSFLSKEGFYLAGGTALSLQIGHRTSVDFDFYIKSHFDTRKLFGLIKGVFGEKAKKTLEEKDTLFVKAEGVDTSFFWYKYPLLEKTKLVKGVPLASLKDIAAMKLIAISHRPAKRDYIDVFFLLEKFNLEQMFSFVSKKYPNFNEYFAARALTYFEDIEEEGKRPIKVFDKNFSWKKAKGKIFEEVKKYQLRAIKR